MKNYRLKAFCKINLSLRVIRKLRNGYHNIMSYITFCDLHDVISVYKIESLKDKISFSGKFKTGINNKFNTARQKLSSYSKKLKLAK